MKAEMIGRKGFHRKGILFRTCPKCGKDLPLATGFRRKGKSHFEKYCISCEDLYSRLGIPLEPEERCTLDDIKGVRFIYNAF